MRELKSEEIKEISGGRWALLKYALKILARTGGGNGSPDRYNNGFHG